MNKKHALAWWFLSLGTQVQTRILHQTDLFLWAYQSNQKLRLHAYICSIKLRSKNVFVAVTQSVYSTLHAWSIDLFYFKLTKDIAPSSWKQEVDRTGFNSKIFQKTE